MERLRLVHEVKMRELGLQSGDGQLSGSPRRFDVSRHISLVPPFAEKEVEKYFSHFECLAATFGWPEDVWTLLLQCVLTGKAQEVYSSLMLTQSC